jgi:hypothetical protein
METIEKLGERLEAMEYRARRMERRLRWWRILACGLVVLGLVTLPFAGGTAQEQSTYEKALARRLAALEYKLVGYNELRNIPNFPDVRTGSHNIVVGRQNNFLALRLSWLFDGRRASIVVTSRQIVDEDLTLRLPGLLSA